jgi:hypothetical protein
MPMPAHCLGCKPLMPSQSRSCSQIRTVKRQWTNRWLLLSSVCLQKGQSPQQSNIGHVPSELFNSLTPYSDPPPISSSASQITVTHHVQLCIVVPIISKRWPSRAHHLPMCGQFRVESNIFKQTEVN